MLNALVNKEINKSMLSVPNAFVLNQLTNRSMSNQLKKELIGWKYNVFYFTYKTYVERAYVKYVGWKNISLVHVMWLI